MTSRRMMTPCVALSAALVACGGAADGEGGRPGGGGPPPMPVDATAAITDTVRQELVATGQIEEIQAI